MKFLYIKNYIFKRKVFYVCIVVCRMYAVCLTLLDAVVEGFLLVPLVHREGLLPTEHLVQHAAHGPHVRLECVYSV
jgi:hypothetical protein